MAKDKPKTTAADVAPPEAEAPALPARPELARGRPTRPAALKGPPPPPPTRPPTVRDRIAKAKAAFARAAALLKPAAPAEVLEAPELELDQEHAPEPPPPATTRTGRKP